MIGIDKLYTNIITTQSGEVPCAGENGELGKIALLSDIPKYYKELETQINNISITGSFTPVSTTANISGALLNEITSQKSELITNINSISKNLDSVTKKAEDTHLAHKITREQIVEAYKQIHEHREKIEYIKNNYLTIGEHVNNIKDQTLKVDSLNSQTNSQINSLNSQIKIANDNYDTLVKQSEENIKLIKNIESINNDTVNQMKILKGEVDKIVTQNKEMMKFMLLIKTKVSGL